MICKDDLTIGILAGGKATRMGNNDKGLINVGGTPFVEILINKIIPHSKDIIINANRNISQYKKYNYCLLYTSPSPRDRTRSRMPSSA